MCVFFFVVLHLQMITLRAVMWQFVFVFVFSFVFYIDDYLESSDMAGHHLCVCVCVFSCPGSSIPDLGQSLGG